MYFDDDKILSYENISLAFIDGPDDRWFWAIVKNYEDCQTYGRIIMSFGDDFQVDNPELMYKILKLVYEEERKIR